MSELAVREPEALSPTVLTNDQLQYIARTEFVPPGLRGNLPAILACVATGRALGIPDMTALRSIHIIDGKATFSAELMVQLVRRQGHSITGDVTDGAATVKGKRADNGDEMSMTWTTGMAERAGLLKKSNWVKYPESMLWARAVSQLCRMLFADCFAGATYTQEELAEGEILLTGDPQEAVPAADAEAEDAAFSQAVQPEPASPVEDDGRFPPADAPEGLSAAQAKKLNVLVGQLRDAGHITTEQLYRVTGREAVPGEDGELHWAPLRDGLSKAEASALIERLTRLEKTVAPGEGFKIPDGVAADPLAYGGPA